jgi:hypothetical protein
MLGMMDWYEQKAKMNLRRAANEPNERGERKHLEFGSPEINLLSAVIDYDTLKGARERFLNGQLDQEEFEYQKKCFIESLKKKIIRYGFTAAELQAHGIKVKIA